MTEDTSAIPTGIQRRDERIRQLETELAEAKDRAMAAEFRLSCAVNANADHEQDYLAVWKLIKQPNETVVQAVQRVVNEPAEARRELSAIKHHMDSCRAIAGVPDDEVLAQWIRDIKSAGDGLEYRLTHQTKSPSDRDAEALANWRRVRGEK